jgi:hypothetical protein
MTTLAHRGTGEEELSAEATVAKSATVQGEGEREVTRKVEYWATQRLREYIDKGFTLDDEWLKRGGGGNYFDERQLDRAAVVARHATDCGRRAEGPPRGRWSRSDERRPDRSDADRGELCADRGSSARIGGSSARIGGSSARIGGSSARIGGSSARIGGELGPDRGELGPDRGELGLGRGARTSRSEEPGGCSTEARFTILLEEARDVAQVI